jgi:hypothetical protein
MHKITILCQCRFKKLQEKKHQMDLVFIEEKVKAYQW